MVRILRQARTVAVLGVLCATAALVAACGSSGSSGSNQATPKVSTSVTTQSAAEPCVASVLAVRGGRQGAGFAGEVEASIVIKNNSRIPCELASSPTIALLAQGNTVPLKVSMGPPTSASGSSITNIDVGPRQKVTASFYWSNWCGQSLGPLTVIVKIGQATVSGPFNGPPGGTAVPRCNNPAAPSVIALIHAYYRD